MYTLKRDFPQGRTYGKLKNISGKIRMQHREIEKKKCQGEETRMQKFCPCINVLPEGENMGKRYQYQSYTEMTLFFPPIRTRFLRFVKHEFPGRESNINTHHTETTEYLVQREN